MTARLYGTTRRLYDTVARALAALRLGAMGTPTTQALIALYVTGLVLLDERQTQTRVTRWLPARCHDALNRLLRTVPLSSRALMGLLISWARGRGQAGYLCVDDVIVEKRWSRTLRWAGWAYAWSQKRQVYGLHVVVVLWCSRDGRWRVPVAFRLWRPKDACAPRRYRTKPALAGAMLRELAAARLPVAFVTFDTMYTAGWLTKLVGRLGWAWVGTPAPRTTVVWRGERLALRAAATRVYAPSFGHLRLVVTRNRHGNYQCLAGNDLTADLPTVVQRKRARWPVETVFRDTKQFAGLAACQARADQATVRHVALVLLTFVVLQCLRHRPAESVATVKERWQLAVLRQGASPPTPLRCCPAELRPTA